MRTPKGLLLALALLIPAALPGCSGGTGGPARPDILLITVDSLRADRPGFAGGPVETPAMDSLAGAGVSFTAAYTPAPQALPALASLHTGRYPAAHGAREEWVTRLDEGAATLARRLKEAGYATAAFAAAMALHPKHGLDQGFDLYADAFGNAPRLTTSNTIGVPGKVIVDDALEWMTGQSDGPPRFVWVNFFDTHFFHTPESPFKERYQDAPYNGEVAMVDEQIGRLLSWLEDHDRDGSTLVILAGSHGEGLGEDGEQYYGLLLGEATTRVPLVIRPAGGLASGRTVERPVSLVDVAPTLLDLLGLEAGGPMDGISLAPWLGARPPAEGAGAADRAVYFETLMPRRLFGWAALRGVRQGDLKYVEAPGTPWRRLVDLAAEPGDARNLAEGRPEEARRLSALAGELGGSFPTERERLDPVRAAEVAGLGFPTDPPDGPLELPTDNLDMGNAALQARRSLQRRMMRSALYLLNDVTSTDPDNYVARLDMAILAIGVGQPDTARGYLTELQALFPADGEIYHQLGHVVLAEGMNPATLERAGRLFRLAASLAPLNEEALYDSACSVSGSDPEEALDYLERAVRNGYRDFKHMAEDSSMDPLRGMDRYREITGAAGDGAAAPEAS